MPGIRTATLAEIYARQGHLDRACAIYRELTEASPDDAGLATRLAELEEARVAVADAGAREGRVARLRTLLARVRARKRSR